MDKNLQINKEIEIKKNDEVFKKQIRQLQLENEIKIWEKNRQALFDIASFDYEIKMHSNNKCNTIAVNNLFNKVIHHLEDKEVYISYKGNYLKFYKELNDKYNKLSDDIKNVDDEIYERDDDDFIYDLKNTVEHYVNIRNRKNKDQTFSCDAELRSNYNLVDTIIEFQKANLGNLYDLVLVKTSDELKKEIITDILTSKKDSSNQISKFLKGNYDYPTWALTNGRTENSDIEFLNGLTDDFTKIIKDYGKNLSLQDKYYLIDNADYSVIETLTKEKYVDFINNVTYHIGKKTCGAPVGILFHHKNATNLKLFYNDSFDNYSDEIKNNTNIYCLEYLLAKNLKNDVINLMNLTNFEITDDIIDVFKEYFLELDDKSQFADKICDIIIHKSKNKDEYKVNSERIKILKLSIDKDKLKELRIELTNILRKFNDYTFENILNQTRLSDLNFVNNRNLRKK